MSITRQELLPQDNTEPIPSLIDRSDTFNKVLSWCSLCLRYLNFHNDRSQTIYILYRNSLIGYRTEQHNVYIGFVQAAQEEYFVIRNIFTHALQRVHQENLIPIPTLNGVLTTENEKMCNMYDLQALYSRHNSNIDQTDDDTVGEIIASIPIDRSTGFITKPDRTTAGRIYGSHYLELLDKETIYGERFVVARKFYADEKVLFMLGRTLCSGLLYGMAIDNENNGLRWAMVKESYTEIRYRVSTQQIFKYDDLESIMKFFHDAHMKEFKNYAELHDSIILSLRFLLFTQDRCYVADSERYYDHLGVANPNQTPFSVIKTCLRRFLHFDQCDDSGAGSEISTLVRSEI